MNNKRAKLSTKISFSCYFFLVSLHISFSTSSRNWKLLKSLAEIEEREFLEVKNSFNSFGESESSSNSRVFVLIHFLSCFVCVWVSFYAWRTFSKSARYDFTFWFFYDELILTLFCCWGVLAPHEKPYMNDLSYDFVKCNKQFISYCQLCNSYV